MMRVNGMSNIAPLTRRKSLREDLDPALNWLNDLGIDHSKTRIGNYRRNLDQLEKLDISKAHLSGDTFDTAVEAADLVIIHKALGKRQDEVLRRRLKEFVKGPVHSRDEKPQAGSTYKARSTGLELLIASHFAMAGFDVSFDTISDVVVSDKRTVFHIECKRPSKIENVEDCIGEAYSQLKTRYDSYKGIIPQRGFAVVSITKCMNPENEQYIFDKEEDIYSALSYTGNQFLEQNRNIFYKGLNELTMGVIMYLQIATSLVGHKGIFIQRQFSSIYVSNTNEPDIKYNNPDRLYFKDITDSLRTGFANAFVT
jgi:hypothetical protein